MLVDKRQVLPRLQTSRKIEESTFWSKVDVVLCLLRFLAVLGHEAKRDPGSARGEVSQSCDGVADLGPAAHLLGPLLQVASWLPMCR